MTAKTPNQRDAELVALLHAVRPYIERAGIDAEARHDDTEGRGYLDGYAYETMQQTRELMDRIDAAIAQSAGCNSQNSACVSANGRL